MDLYISGGCDYVTVGGNKYNTKYYFAWNGKDDVVFWCGETSYKVTAGDLLDTRQTTIKCGIATVTVKERRVELDKAEKLAYPVLDLTLTR